MKNRILLLSLLLLLATGITSCNLFPEPEKPNYQLELETLLPGTQYLVAYFPGSDYGRFQLQWMQQLAGVRGSHALVDVYNLQGDYLDDSWNLYYRNIFPNLFGIISSAEKVGSKSYRGIARILTAWNLGMMTDVWGDIPNSAALDYMQGFFPAYDSQENIYVYFLDLLNGAISDLNTSISSDTLKPGKDQDLIYEGDLQKWIRAAHAIRLRYMLRLAHQADNYELVASYLTAGNLFTSNQDDMEYYFTGIQLNPHYFYDNQIRNTRLGEYFVESLKASNDPRLPVYVKKSTHDNQYTGSAPGEKNLNASYTGSTIADQYAPISLMTFVEQKFIEAEIHQRMGQQAQADQAFETAVKASLQKYNVSNPEWEAQYASIQNVSLQQIIQAKYTALFLNPEVFSDFRRTGYPQLTPYSSGSGIARLPRRFIYPSEEDLYNSPNVPTGIDVFDRVWWDVEQ